jgi:hypothetical protein
MRKRRKRRRRRMMRKRRREEALGREVGKVLFEEGCRLCLEGIYWTSVCYK